MVDSLYFLHTELADSPINEDVDDFGDDFEQTLLENIDGATQKRFVFIQCCCSFNCIKVK